MSANPSLAHSQTRTPMRTIMAAVLVMVVAACQTEADAPIVVHADHAGILADVRANAAPLTVVNMWATWCAPCIEEFPYFMALERDFAEEGVEVVFVSVDFEDELPAVHDFLAERSWTDTTYFKTERDNDFVNGFSPAWTGAVPATFVYDAQGQQRGFWEGSITEDSLYAKIRRYLHP